MLDFLHWILTLVLAVVAGLLWRELRAKRLPQWLLELDQEDLVTREELDHFHLRVVQLSRTQRDLLQAQLEETFRARSNETGEAEFSVSEGGLDALGSAPIIPAQAAAEAVLSAPLPSPSEPSPGSVPDTISDPEGEPAWGSASDPTTRALNLFRAGRTIEQIAQELRIGRQEAQLLIRMAHRKVATLAGT